MNENIVEVRLDECDRWCKHIKAVDPRAKSGHDWEGDWLPRDGRLVDLPIGALIAFCDDVGSRKHPEDRVILGVVDSDGGVIYTERYKGKGWAVELRKVAKEVLALDTAHRLAWACDWTAATASEAHDKAAVMIEKAIRAGEEYLVTLRERGIEKDGYYLFPRTSILNCVHVSKDDTPETAEAKIRAEVERVTSLWRAKEEEALKRAAHWRARADALRSPRGEEADEPAGFPLDGVPTDDLVRELKARGVSV